MGDHFDGLGAGWDGVYGYVMCGVVVHFGTGCSYVRCGLDIGTYLGTYLYCTFG